MDSTYKAAVLFRAEYPQPRVTAGIQSQKQRAACHNFPNLAEVRKKHARMFLAQKRRWAAPPIVPSQWMLAREVAGSLEKGVFQGAVLL